MQVEPCRLNPEAQVFVRLFPVPLDLARNRCRIILQIRQLQKPLMNPWPVYPVRSHLRRGPIRVSKSPQAKKGIQHPAIGRLVSGISREASSPSAAHLQSAPYRCK